MEKDSRKFLAPMSLSQLANQIINLPPLSHSRCQSIPSAIVCSMLRPTNVLRNAASALEAGPSSRPRLRAQVMSFQQWCERSPCIPHISSLTIPSDKVRPENRPTGLLLHEVPRCAMPTDVLRALRDIGAVNDDFPLSGSMPILLSPAPLEKLIRHIQSLLCPSRCLANHR